LGTNLCGENANNFKIFGKKQWEMHVLAVAFRATGHQHNPWMPRHRSRHPERLGHLLQGQL
jgi:hypothetical protein